MEKIIAYKSFNGRLFETEEKCLAYEKKLSEYPKVKEYNVRGLVWDNEKGEEVLSDIVRHTIARWEKPSSARKDETYYVISDKYKFFDLFNQYDNLLMSGRYADNHNWHFALDIVEMIVSGTELTDDVITNALNTFNTSNEVKYSMEVIESNKIWIIDNPKWHSGAFPPYAFKIEKI